jgi:aldehyde:ferredoxin oxidoreductase
MLRAMNARLGIGRQADRLPQKFFQPLTGGGPTDGVALTHDEVEAALQEYYAQAGWDQTSGNPTPETLERLGLEWVA